jgi:hypothetical protein
VDEATPWASRPPRRRHRLRLSCWAPSCAPAAWTFSFTPVLDLDHGGSTVIGDRAFHRDARVTTMLAKSVMHGLLQSGMAQLRQALPRPRLRQGRLHVDIAGGQAQPEGHPGRRRGALRLAQHQPDA